MKIDIPDAETDSAYAYYKKLARLQWAVDNVPECKTDDYTLALARCTIQWNSMSDRDESAMFKKFKGKPKCKPGTCKTFTPLQAAEKFRYGHCIGTESGCANCWYYQTLMYDSNHLKVKEKQKQPYRRFNRNGK